MTKKLYLYNKICYDECPYGSKKNDKNETCDEINIYISINTSITVNLFKENNEEFILKYLGEYANNSVDIKRAPDFSNYFYNQSTNYSYRLVLQMPIFDFSDCIEKIRMEYKLYNNNIFYGIMEYNDQTNKNGKYNKNSNLVNSTTYQFFLENGTILDYHICKGINITTEKKVETNKINIKEVKEIDNKYNISIFNHTEEIFNDYCIGFNIFAKDLTLYERQMLLNKYKPPCDEGCTFHSFNYETNYSTCICPIKLEDDLDIKEKIYEEFKENEYINLVIKNSNFKYFLCYKKIIRRNEDKLTNYLTYISLTFLSLNFCFYAYSPPKIILDKIVIIKMILMKEVNMEIIIE